MWEPVGVMVSKSLNCFSDPPVWPCRPRCQADRRHVSIPRHHSRQSQSFYIACPTFSDNSKDTYTHTPGVLVTLILHDQIPERNSLRFVGLFWLV